MVQDKIPVQDIPSNMLQQSPPQTNPEPEMGTAAAAAYDTSPSLLRNPPPIPAETVHLSAPDMARLFAVLAGMEASAKERKEEMNNKMGGIKTYAKELKEEIKKTTQTE